MKFVLDDFVYLCDKDRLPDQCYYFDTKRFGIIGKFGDIIVFYVSPDGGFQYEEMRMPGIFESYDLTREMKDIARNYSLMQYHYHRELRDTSQSIPLYLGYLERHKKQIEFAKSKILDFYIKHKPNQTKSSRNVIQSQ